MTTESLLKNFEKSINNSFDKMEKLFIYKSFNDAIMKLYILGCMAKTDKEYLLETATKIYHK